MACFCCVMLRSKILTYYGYAAVLSPSQALHNLRQIAYLNGGVAGFCCVMLCSKIAVKGALEPLEALGVATTAKNKTLLDFTRPYLTLIDLIGEAVATKQQNTPQPNKKITF